MPSGCLGPHAAQCSSRCPDTCAGSTGHTDWIKDAWQKIFMKTTLMCQHFDEFVTLWCEIGVHHFSNAAPKCRPLSCKLRPVVPRMPRGLALDLQEGRMYWAEDGTMKLRSATLDGQDLQDVPCHV